jgi:Resolvase, N terminal domain
MPIEPALPVRFKAIGLNRKARVIASLNQPRENAIPSAGLARMVAAAKQIQSTYQDTMSGAKANRPGLDKLMADARQRRFDAVLVWKLDRFGRSLVHCVSGIQELSSLGVRFIATSQGLDTDESSDWVPLSIGTITQLHHAQECLALRTTTAIMTALGKDQIFACSGQPSTRLMIDVRLSGSSCFCVSP